MSSESRQATNVEIVDAAQEALHLAWKAEATLEEVRKIAVRARQVADNLHTPLVSCALMLDTEIEKSFVDSARSKRDSAGLAGGVDIVEEAHKMAVRYLSLAATSVEASGQTGDGVSRIQIARMLTCLGLFLDYGKSHAGGVVTWMRTVATDIEKHY